ncbi:MAG TPA: YoaK family protein [Solirubrobacter sp.]
MRRLLLPAGHGSLPGLLVGLTVVTGLVDAVSYIALGRVFVANMTGNVVLLGFAVAGEGGLSIAASLTAIAAFLAGAAAGGELGRRIADRGALLSAGAAVGTVLLALACVCGFLAGDPVDGAWRYVLIVLMAIALGGQNAVARKLAIPDLTTTVLTLTLTGLAADGFRAFKPRRLVAVVAMFAGALVGGLLTLGPGPAWALLLAVAITAGVAASAERVRARGGAQDDPRL